LRNYESPVSVSQRREASESAADPAASRSFISQQRVDAADRVDC
jgi:hypothetical protein